MAGRGWLVWEKEKGGLSRGLDPRPQFLRNLNEKAGHPRHNPLENRMTAGSTGLLDRLRTAGIDPGDSDEQRLNKSLLMFATGLASVASMLWLVIYWSLGPQLSSTLPFVFQILLATNLAVYIKWGNFDFFRLSQLALFLFFPFVVQWLVLIHICLFRQTTLG